MAWLPRYFIESEVSFHATCSINLSLFVAKQIWTWVVKRATYHRFSTRSAAMLQGRLHVFVARFAVALLVVCDLLLAPSICFFLCALRDSRTKTLICFVYYHERQSVDHANNIWFRLAVSFVNCKRKWKLCQRELEDNSRPYNKTVQIKTVFLFKRRLNLLTWCKP